jgi:hypothetical protein
MANFIPYDPRYMEFDDWAALICEQYGAQNIVIPFKGMNWQDWAAGLLAIDIFANEAAPNPYTFNDWRDWAEQLIGAVNAGIE